MAQKNVSQRNITLVPIFRNNYEESLSKLGPSHIRFPFPDHHPAASGMDQKELLEAVAEIDAFIVHVREENHKLKVAERETTTSLTDKIAEERAAKERSLFV